ncbi:hypothetical protein PVAP13_2KG114000 [Panicum virgatum]|uniref:Replication factor A C-terminal domain-containing protein n=1 Tax=Panicum virgatum TaxID=38727 RepID=A0A8T0W3X2_PANVG|nr:hypothetical protein PVAP13_2KG114000 [Panicum virgatum]
MRFASAGRRFSFGDGSAATGDTHAEQGSVEMEADRGRDRADGRVHRAEMASAGGVSDGDGLLSGFGGTGKTFLWNCILSKLRSQVSRVTSQEGLKILIENEDGTSGTATKNIVYRMTCIPLKDINQGSYKTKICARLTRLSEFILDDKPEQIQRLDFVLLDVEGHAIEAQVPQQHISRFLSRLKEGTVYFVEFFQVVPCRTNYRAVSHTYMIKFTCHTRVTEFNAAPPTLPKYAYTLASFDTLRTRIDYTADMSGLKKAIRHLYISDGRESIEVVLWSRQATEFPAEKIIELSKEKPIILLLLGIIAKSREGQLKIQGSMSCQYHINPAIPEAAALINKFTGFPHQVTWTGAATSSSSDIMTTSVTELAKLTNPHELYGNIYQVNVVLRTISPNQPWWYLGCILCRKRVFPEGETYRCPKCSGNKAEPMYRIVFIAADPDNFLEDNAPTIEITFFGNMGQELTGIPVLQLAAISEGNNVSIPPEITRLYSHKYTLAISVPFSSMQRENVSYQVKNIITTAGPVITTKTIYPATSGTGQQQTKPTQDTTRHLPVAETTKLDSNKEEGKVATPLPSPQRLQMETSSPTMKQTTSSEDDLAFSTEAGTSGKKQNEM